MEPVSRVYGHIPANWLGQGVPVRSLVAPRRGYSIDEMLQAAAANRTFDPSDSNTDTADLEDDNSTITTDSNELFSLVHETSGLKLSSNSNDAALVSANNNSATTRWQIIDAGDAHVFIENPETNQRLRLQDNGDVHMTSATSSGDDVRWRIASNPDGTVFIHHFALGEKLHASSATNNVPNSVAPVWTGSNVRWNIRAE